MNIYRERLLDHYQNPRNTGALDDASTSSTYENVSCGDHITVYLKVQDEIITKMTYDVEGCAVSIASASLLSEYAIGKTTKQIQDLTIEKMIDLIGIELTPSRIKCASVSLQALKSALKNNTKETI